MEKEAIRYEKAVVIYSGGMDSFTLLHNTLDSGMFETVDCVSVDYGQRHKKELEIAAKVCQDLKLTHKIIDLSGLADILPGSSLTDPSIEVPEGHYAAETMTQTVVPNRNAILISLAAAYAASIKAHNLYYGAHAGDHHIYKDCRPPFIQAMQKLLSESLDFRVLLFAPYQHRSKGDIVKLGVTLGIDYGDSWTCYKGNALACGKCGSCVERLEAMAFAGITDPLEYENA